jgi:hypothetical protein
MRGALFEDPSAPGVDHCLGKGERPLGKSGLRMAVRYDLIVIGGGPAGEKGGSPSSALRKRVARGRPFAAAGRNGSQRRRSPDQNRSRGPNHLSEPWPARQQRGTSERPRPLGSADGTQDRGLRAVKHHPKITPMYHLKLPPLVL